MQCDLCGNVAAFGSVCSLCALKAPADQLRQAMALNLQSNSVEELMTRFVIDDHQAKHYAGGDRSYAHFDSAEGSLDWRSVHRVICYATAQILTLLRSQKQLKPVDGYVQFTDLRGNQQWYAGRNRGYTNVVMVQLRATVKDGFGGHGYPLDQHRVQALPKNAWIAQGTFAATAEVELNAANNAIRIMKIGH